MQIIPVIDIKAGQAVLAKQGDRQIYQPLSTPLCASSQVKDVLNAYLNLYPFSHIYLADLDALMNTGNNQDLIYALAAEYPQLNFMVDCGTQNTLFSPKNILVIIGTESADKHALIKIKQQTNDFILSLDYCRQNEPMGDPFLYKTPALWPNELIIMSLGRVGKNSGPDLIKLQQYCHTYPGRHFIAAGGIRNRQDLIRLEEIGVHQALVASALHLGTLTACDIQLLFT